VLLSVLALPVAILIFATLLTRLVWWLTLQDLFLVTYKIFLTYIDSKAFQVTHKGFFWWLSRLFWRFTRLFWCCTAAQNLGIWQYKFCAEQNENDGDQFWLGQLVLARYNLEVLYC
jgi:hypothetical protein